MQTCYYRIERGGNKVGNAFINKPSVLYLFKGDNEIWIHSMVGVGHPSFKCNIDRKFSTSLHPERRFATYKLIM